jgi:hypothetical protein
LNINLSEAVSKRKKKEEKSEKQIDVKRRERK